MAKFHCIVSVTHFCKPAGQGFNPTLAVFSVVLFTELGFIIIIIIIMLFLHPKDNLTVYRECSCCVVYIMYATMVFLVEN